VRKRICVKRSC